MAKTLVCREVGFDCDAVVRAEDEQQILDQAARHAKDVHGVDVDEGMEQQLRGLIRTE